MIIIEYDRRFKKNFQTRISSNKKLLSKFGDRLKTFKENRQNPILKDHKLKGEQKWFRAFSIAGNIRVIYFEQSQDRFIFLDVGTHNQVYN